MVRHGSMTWAADILTMIQQQLNGNCLLKYCGLISRSEAAEQGCDYWQGGKLTIGRMGEGQVSACSREGEQEGSGQVTLCMQGPREVKAKAKGQDRGPSPGS